MQTRVFYGWRVVIGMMVALAITGPAAVTVANIYQNPVQESLGISPSLFALSNSMILGVGVVLSPYLSLRLARGDFKKNYQLGLVIYSLGLAGMGLAPNIWLFYLASLLTGLGYQLTSIIPANLLVNNWFIHQRGIAMSVVLSGLGVGGVVFANLVTWMIETYSWRFSYLAYAAIMLVVVSLVNRYVIVVKPEDIGLEPLGADQARLDPETSGREASQVIHRPFEETRGRPFFVLLLVGAFLIGVILNGGLGQFPPYLANLHSPAAAARVISTYSAVGVVGKLVLGLVIDRWGIQASLVYSAILNLACFALMTQASSYPLAILAAVCFGMGNAVGSVTPPLLVSAIYSQANFSQANGYQKSALYAGMALGSFLTGWVSQVSGSYHTAWLLLATLVLVATLVWLASYRQAQQYTE